MLESIELAKRIVIKYLRDDELTAAIADFYWNLFNALTSKGFNRETAIEIIKSARLDSIQTK